MTPWLLALLAAILFYALVERRHKVLLAKGVAGVAVVAGAVILVLYVRERAQEGEAERRRRAVRVTPLVESWDPRSGSPPPLELLGWGPQDHFPFELCNRNPHPTRAVEFTLSGRRAGYSNLYAIRRPAGGTPPHRSTRFSSDRIVGPGACDTVRFAGPFDRYDHYIVTIVRVDLFDETEPAP